MNKTRLASLLAIAGAWLKAGAVALVRLQSVLGLLMLYAGAASIWRPAVGLLVVGSLLVLAEVCAALRGKAG